MDKNLPTNGREDAQVTSPAINGGSSGNSNGTNGNPGGEFTPDLNYDTLAYLLAFPKEFHIKYSTSFRAHRLEMRTDGEFPPTGIIFQKLTQTLQVTQRNKVGQPTHWRWRQRNFKMVLGRRGGFTLWPHGEAPNVVRTLHEFLIKKCKFTDDEFAEFVRALHLFRIEIASQVDENGDGLLRKGKVCDFEVSKQQVKYNFDDDSILAPAKGVVKLDTSPGVDLLEQEISGHLKEATDAHMVFIRALQVAGHLHDLREEQLQQKPRLEKALQSADQFRVDLTQSEKRIITRVDQAWTGLGVLNKSATRTELKTEQVLEALAKIEQKYVTPGLTAKDYKIGVSRTVNAIAKFGNRIEDQIQDVKDLIEEKNVEAELRNTDLSNDIAKQGEALSNEILDVNIKVDCTLDQTKQVQKILEQHASDTEQQHLRQDIRIANVMDQCKEIRRQLQDYHQGQIFQTAFVARRVQALDDRLAGMDKTLQSLATLFQMTMPAFLKQVVDARDYLEHLRQEMHGNRIHQDTLNLVTLAYIILGRFPDRTYRQLAEMLGIKRPRIYRIVNTLETLSDVAREKRVPVLEPLGDQVAVGSISRTAEDPIVSVGIKPAKPKTRKRPIWHIFRRNRSSELKLQSNEKLKPEDEKT